MHRPPGKMDSMRGLQTVVGLIVVALGCVHFADRDRPQDSRRQFYLGTPSTVVGRSGLALLEIIVGFVLLFAEMP